MCMIGGSGAITTLEVGASCTASPSDEGDLRIGWLLHGRMSQRSSWPVGLLRIKTCFWLGGLGGVGFRRRKTLIFEMVLTLLALGSRSKKLF